MHRKIRRVNDLLKGNVSTLYMAWLSLEISGKFYFLIQLSSENYKCQGIQNLCLFLSSFNGCRVPITILQFSTK